MQLLLSVPSIILSPVIDYTPTGSSVTMLSVVIDSDYTATIQSLCLVGDD